jgi:hypothetical protein
MHLIPWVLLKQALAFDGDETDPATTVTLSARTLRLLIEAAAAAQPFDEVSYLRANPDVARSVRDGHCQAAHAHYGQIGYYEGRVVGRAGFDEAWYLERYPDVKQAVARGDCQSGYEHYCGSGVREWRSPNASVEADILAWHQAVSEKTRPPSRVASRLERQRPIRRRAKA